MTLEERVDLDAFDRERRESDQRYNDALTSLDRAVLATDGRELTRDDFDRVATALVVFLQQITAFVESKDRQLAGETAARFETVDQSLGAVAELRAQIGVLTRATDMLRRGASPQSSAGSPQSSAGSPQSSAGSPQSSAGNPQSSAGNPQSAARNPQSAARNPQSAIRTTSSSEDDYKYVGFEDQFRGSDEAIAGRLRAYLPIFEGRSHVLDVGCGRGEFLAALGTAGVTACGVDTNGDMVAVANERGLEAVRADAVSYLMSLPDASLGGLIATQVVEHLEPSYLMRFLDAAARKLKRDAPIVLETINPACWLAFFSSYIRDFTHVRPVHPDTLQYLLRASGFERVVIHYSAPVPDQMKMKTIDLTAGVLASSDDVSRSLTQMAHTINANAVILNNLMFTYLDYAAVGYRI
jgi:SAM-dependent methyltransferase